MASQELYHAKQQYILGAFKYLVDLTLPDENSPDHLPLLLYKARSHIALNDSTSALDVLPSDSENVAVKATAALARFVGATETSDKDAALEELRDLSIEIEGDDVEGSEADKALVRVLAGTAFIRANEIEEALETLGSESEDLEAVSIVVQIYLSINRPDLARKEYERSKRWAEDDLLLQLIESNIGLVTGKDSYSNTNSFYTEQLGNPSLKSPHILTARGVTRILRNEIQESKSDLEESLERQKEDAETLAALVVAGGLGAFRKSEAEELWDRLQNEHPSHPLVLDVHEKAELFDAAAAKFEIPQVALPSPA